MAFQCTVVTPEEQIFNDTVISVILPAYDGEVGVLTDRAPLLAKLGAGRLQITMPGGRERTLFVAGGVAQMLNNVLTVVTNEAEEPADINVETTRAELAEAQARRITDDASFEDRDRQIRRAKAKLEMAGAR